jgi:hypothetical protein
MSYTIYGNVLYNGTAFANANVSLLSDGGGSYLSKTVSNASGGYSFNSLVNGSYYGVVALYRNATALLSASGYIFMNGSESINKNLDFYSSGTTTTNNYYLGCQCVQYLTGYYIRNISVGNNQCYSVSSLS